MMRPLFVFFIAAAACSAQLTTAQKTADFRNLADFFAKNYALTDWKRTALNRNPFDLRPWLDRVAASGSDLEFYEIMSEWVAALEDGHSSYANPSTFVARLPFTVDVYEGKVIVDSIERDQVPADSFAFQIGDELLSIDGVTAPDLLAMFRKLVGDGAAPAHVRTAAGMITFRRQARIPRASEVPDLSQIAFRNAAGETATYSIPWRKTGTPIARLPGSPEIIGFRPMTSAAAAAEPVSIERQQLSAVAEERAVLGFGLKTPVFSLEVEGFAQRRGTPLSDRIVSGIFTNAAGLRIGYIRFPTFNDTSAFSQAVDEVLAMANNTDGLIFDVMRNGGGVACRAESLMSALSPANYSGMRLARRVNWLDLAGWRELVTQLEQAGIGGAALDLARETAAALEDAARSGSALTAPIGLCAAGVDRTPLLDRTGNSVAYTKPVVMLVDSYSFSAAEGLAALFQDAARGLVLGVRTGGAGGTVLSGTAGVYSEGDVSYSASILLRNREVSTEGLPSGPYIENHGVHPDVVIDYMTLENLREKGRPFLTQVLEKTAEHIAASQ